MNHNDIYDPSFVQKLFDEMSGTYGIVNLISSFGFARRWRRQCVRQLDFSPGFNVIDMMTGMGELCPDLSRRIGPTGHITALDLSPVMCRKARSYENNALPCRVEVVQADALHSELPSEVFDVAVSSFGLKTFNPRQIERLAVEVHRVLKPGGVFSFVEISVPHFTWLRAAYLFYLNHVVPHIGRALLGNPDNYRLLGVYTQSFGDCRDIRAIFQAAGLIHNCVRTSSAVRPGWLEESKSRCGSPGINLVPRLSTPTERVFEIRFGFDRDCRGLRNASRMFVLLSVFGRWLRRWFNHHWARQGERPARDCQE